MKLSPWPKRERKKYDCGSLGMLTVPEIMAVSGMCDRSVRRRICAGVRGDALCAPGDSRSRRVRDHYRDSCHVPHSASGNIYVACLIARRYSRSLPTVAELRSQFQMSRATAYRWLAALNAVYGVNR